MYYLDIIENERKKRGMTKKDILDLTYLEFKSGYKYLNGERRLRRDDLINILIGLDFTYYDIQIVLLTNMYPLLYIDCKYDVYIMSNIRNLHIQDNPS